MYSAPASERKDPGVTAAPALTSHLILEKMLKNLDDLDVNTLPNYFEDLKSLLSDEESAKAVLKTLIEKGIVIYDLKDAAGKTLLQTVKPQTAAYALLKQQEEQVLAQVKAMSDESAKMIQVWEKAKKVSDYLVDRIMMRFIAGDISPVQMMQYKTSQSLLMAIYNLIIINVRKERYVSTPALISMGEQGTPLNRLEPYLNAILAGRAVILNTFEKIRGEESQLYPAEAEKYPKRLARAKFETELEKLLQRINTDCNSLSGLVDFEKLCSEYNTQDINEIEGGKLIQRLGSIRIQLARDAWPAFASLSKEQAAAYSKNKAFIAALHAYFKSTYHECMSVLHSDKCFDPILTLLRLCKQASDPRYKLDPLLIFGALASPLAQHLYLWMRDPEKIHKDRQKQIEMLIAIADVYSGQKFLVSTTVTNGVSLDLGHLAQQKIIKLSAADTYNQKGNRTQIQVREAKKTLTQKVWDAVVADKKSELVTLMQDEKFDLGEVNPRADYKVSLEYGPDFTFREYQVLGEGIIYVKPQADGLYYQYNAFTGTLSWDDLGLKSEDERSLKFILSSGSLQAQILERLTKADIINVPNAPKTIYIRKRKNGVLEYRVNGRRCVRNIPVTRIFEDPKKEWAMALPPGDLKLTPTICDEVLEVALLNGHISPSNEPLIPYLILNGKAELLAAVVSYMEKIEKQNQEFEKASKTCPIVLLQSSQKIPDFKDDKTIYVKSKDGKLAYYKKGLKEQQTHFDMPAILTPDLAEKMPRQILQHAAQCGHVQLKAPVNVSQYLSMTYKKRTPAQIAFEEEVKEKQFKCLAVLLSADKTISAPSRQYFLELLAKQPDNPDLKTCINAVWNYELSHLSGEQLYCRIMDGTYSSDQKDELHGEKFITFLSGTENCARQARNNLYTYTERPEMTNRKFIEDAGNRAQALKLLTFIANLYITEPARNKVLLCLSTGTIQRYKHTEFFAELTSAQPMDEKRLASYIHHDLLVETIIDDIRNQRSYLKRLKYYLDAQDSSMNLGKFFQAAPVKFKEEIQSHLKLEREIPLTEAVVESIYGELSQFAADTNVLKELKTNKRIIRALYDYIVKLEDEAQLKVLSSIFEDENSVLRELFLANPDFYNPLQNLHMVMCSVKAAPAAAVYTSVQKENDDNDLDDFSVSGMSSAGHRNSLMPPPPRASGSTATPQSVLRK